MLMIIILTKEVSMVPTVNKFNELVQTLESECIYNVEEDVIVHVPSGRRYDKVGLLYEDRNEYDTVLAHGELSTVLKHKQTLEHILGDCTFHVIVITPALVPHLNFVLSRAATKFPTMLREYIELLSRYATFVRLLC